MTVEQLGALAGVLLSLAFSYVPGLSDKYATLDKVKKSLVMLGLLALVAVGTLLLSCVNILSAVACTQAGALSLLSTFVAAAVANQTTYLLSPQKTAAK
jgi:hypothetical protein